MAEMHQDIGRVIVALQAQLVSAGVSIAAWGRGEAKTLQQLAREIQCGESAVVNMAGAVTRTLTVASADVFYKAPDGQSYQLIEAKQVFLDGRVRHRSLKASVSEKLVFNENPYQGMLRGIREELGIEGDVLMRYKGVTDQTRPSQSYPGLLSRYIHHKFEVDLLARQFNPDGYIETQPDKTTYFRWQAVS